MRDAIRIGAGDAHAQHAAERMRDDFGLVDLEMVEQRNGVARQRIEMQFAIRLGGFAEADLVRHHDAETCLAQHLDDGRPVAGREIAPVQQHHGAAVRLRRRDVHIGHAELLAVIDDGKEMHGVGIGKAFKRDAIGLALGRCRRRGMQTR